MNNNKLLSDATAAGRPLNISRWALEVECYDWYNQFNAWTNPEVAGLAPLFVDSRGFGHYILHLAGLA